MTDKQKETVEGFRIEGSRKRIVYAASSPKVIWMIYRRKLSFREIWNNKLSVRQKMAGTKYSTEKLTSSQFMLRQDRVKLIG